MPFNSSNVFQRIWAFVDQFEAGDKITRTDLDIAFNDVVGGLNFLATGMDSYKTVAEFTASGAGYDEAPVGSVFQIATMTYKVVESDAVEFHIESSAGPKGDGGLRAVEAGMFFSSLARAQSGDTLGLPLIYTDGRAFIYEDGATDLVTGDGRSWRESPAMADEIASQVDLKLAEYNDLSKNRLDALVGTGPAVFVATGQSNGAGKYPFGPNPYNPLVWTYDPVDQIWVQGGQYDALPWTRTQPDGNGGNNNFALGKAHRFAEETGREAFIIYDFVGGQPISQWKGVDSPRYASLAQRVADALATPVMINAGKTTIDAFIWIQGEADFQRSFDDYLADLQTLDDQLVAEAWCGERTPRYIMQMARQHESYFISAAQRHFCQQSNGRWRYVPTRSLQTPFDATGAGDSTHWLGESLFSGGYDILAPLFLNDLHFNDASVDPLFWARGAGPADAGDAVVISSFDTLINRSSRTDGPGVFDTFSGDGVTLTFTSPRRHSTVFKVEVDGVLLATPDDYSVSGRDITFVAAPAAGTDNITVRYQPRNLSANSVGSIGWGINAYPDGNYTFAGGNDVRTDNLSNNTFLWGRDLFSTENGDNGMGSGFQNVLDAANAFVAGRGNTVADEFGASFGSFSTYITPQVDPVLFQVGNGTTDSNRSNILTLFSGGMEVKAATPAKNPLEIDGLVIRRTNAGDQLQFALKVADGSIKTAILNLNDGTVAQSSGPNLNLQDFIFETGIILLNVLSVANPNAITAETANSDLVSVSPQIGHKYRATLTAANTSASPTLSINGTVLTLQDVDGGPLPLGYFTGGTYLLAVGAGNTAKIVADPVTAAQNVSTQQRLTTLEAGLANAKDTNPFRLWPGDAAILAEDQDGPSVFVSGGRLTAKFSDDAIELATDGVLLAANDETPILWAVDGVGGFYGEQTIRTGAWPGDPFAWLKATNGASIATVAPSGTVDFPYGVTVNGEPIQATGGGGFDTLTPDQIGADANVFGAYRISDTQRYYMSDQFVIRGERRTIGFIEYDALDANGAPTIVSMAETSSVATGVFAYGSGTIGNGSTSFEPYSFHVFDENRLPAEDNQGASLFAFGALTTFDIARRALPTVFAVTEFEGGTSLAGMVSGTQPHTDFLAKVTLANALAVSTGKTLYCDRIHLAAGGADIATSKSSMNGYYAGLVNSLSSGVNAITGQGQSPTFVINQPAGSDQNGTSPDILAVGEFVQTNPMANALVPSPTYHLPIVPASASQLTSDSAALLAEISAFAMDQHAREIDTWYCPSVVSATLVGSTIEVEFSTLGDMEFDPDMTVPNEGFAVDGITNGAVITDVTVTPLGGNTDSQVVITFDIAPTGTLTLRYAYGETGTIGSGEFANKGKLRDSSWSAPSEIISGVTHWRRALAFQINVT